MPKGLPPDISTIVQALGRRFNNSIHGAIQYFEIPSISELQSSWAHAISVRLVQ